MSFPIYRYKKVNCIFNFREICLQVRVILINSVISITDESRERRFTSFDREG